MVADGLRRNCKEATRDAAVNVSCGVEGLKHCSKYTGAWANASRRYLAFSRFSV